MDLAKTFDVKQIETQLNAAVDQVEKNTNSVLEFVQPAQVRDGLVTLNKAYFDFARTAMTNVKTFGVVADKVSKEFTKNFEKAVKTA
jgi:hypothetical protein